MLQVFGLPVRGVGGGGDGGAGPSSRQCILAPPGQPSVLSTSNSRVALDAARTPYLRTKVKRSEVKRILQHCYNAEPYARVHLGTQAQT